MTTERKYVLDKTPDKEHLYRIRAVRDFGNIKKGTIGGWVTSERNLSHDGDCWIYDNAMVYENAIVCDNAKVRDNAKIFDNVKVCGNSLVEGCAVIRNNAIVSDYSIVNGFADVKESSEIKDNAHITGKATIYGNSKIYDSALISGNSYVFGNAKVCGNAALIGKITVSENATIGENSILSGIFSVKSNAIIAITSRMRELSFNYCVSISDEALIETDHDVIYIPTIEATFYKCKNNKIAMYSNLTEKNIIGKNNILEYINSANFTHNWKYMSKLGLCLALTSFANDINAEGLMMINQIRA